MKEDTMVKLEKAKDASLSLVHDLSGIVGDLDLLKTTLSTAVSKDLASTAFNHIVVVYSLLRTTIDMLRREEVR